MVKRPLAAPDIATNKIFKANMISLDLSLGEIYSKLDALQEELTATKAELAATKAELTALAATPPG